MYFIFLGLPQISYMKEYSYTLIFGIKAGEQLLIISIHIRKNNIAL